jgi:glycine cleavage system H protein
MSDVPSGLKYTKDHEWAKVEGGNVMIGVTAFAVEQLGDITLINVDVKPGDVVVAGKTLGTIESVKTLSDIFSPVSGKVVKVNAELETRPELVNEDCYGKGWIVVIAGEAASTHLMDEKAYAKLLETAH